MSWKSKLTHDNGARATFDRDSLQLTVSYGGQSVVVPCMKFLHNDQKKENGPTPKGLYLIDVQRYNQNIGNIPWYNLHLQLQDGSGFYGYGQNWKSMQAQHRANFGIHQALNLTHGCVAAYQFEKVQNLLNKGTIKYNGQNFCGFLTVK